MHRPIIEILIIVVGVLIALGVDSWNDHRIDRTLEAEYLTRIAGDLNRNVERAGELAAAFDRKLALLSQIDELANDSHSPQLNSESILATLGSSVELGWMLPPFQLGTFEELRSTGNLGLIQNVELRAALGDFHFWLPEVLARIPARKTDFPRLVYTLIPAGQLYEAMPGVNLSLDQVASPKSSVDAKISEEFQMVIQSSEFRRLLNAERNYATFGKAAVESLQSPIEEMLARVQEEMAN